MSTGGGDELHKRNNATTSNFLFIKCSSSSRKKNSSNTETLALSLAKNGGYHAVLQPAYLGISLPLFRRHHSFTTGTPGRQPSLREGRQDRFFLAPRSTIANASSGGSYQTSNKAPVYGD